MASTIPLSNGRNVRSAPSERALSNPSAWDAGFLSLVSFVNREGHALVPQDHREGSYPLGRWVAAQQRQARRWGTLSASSAAALTALPGWSWDATWTRWQEGLKVLSRFAAREGHARVPVRHVEDGFALGRWVSKQRIAYRHGRIHPQRVSALEAVAGWTWDARASK